MSVEEGVPELVVGDETKLKQVYQPSILTFNYHPSGAHIPL